MSNLNQPHPDLLKLRAFFILQGTTFTKYCQEHNINRRNAHSAITGKWKGKKALKLKKRIFDDAIEKSFNILIETPPKSKTDL